MKGKRRIERWLSEVLTFSHRYKGHEVSAYIAPTGGLHVIVYADPDSELVWRGDNICSALSWIDEQTIDQHFS